MENKLSVNDILDKSKELNLGDVIVIGTVIKDGNVVGLELNTTIPSGLAVTHLIHKTLFELSSEHVRAVIREAEENMGKTDV